MFWYATFTTNEDEDQTQTDRRRFGSFDSRYLKVASFRERQIAAREPQKIGAKQIPSLSKMAVSHD